MQKNTAKGYQSLINDLKKCLKDEVLEEVTNVGLRESMIREYKNLSRATSNLLKLLETYNFSEQLAEEDSKRYAELMGMLGMTGVRCQILVEQSRDLDNEAYLAVAPVESRAIN